MIIEGFSSKEWIDISDIISEYCPDNELLNKLIKQIDDKTNLFKEFEEFLIQHGFNPVFVPERSEIENLSGGCGLLKRCSFYKTDKGKGVIQFKKDYQKYVMSGPSRISMQLVVSVVICNQILVEIKSYRNN